MVAMASATEMMIAEFSPQVLSDRAVIRIAGEGALAFLHNLLTTDLTATKPAYAALLTPQGKILHDLFVLPDGDVIWLDVAEAQVADLLKRLIMYRLRAKLEIVVNGEKAVAVTSQDGLSGLSYADPRTPAMGYRAIVSANDFSNGEGYNLSRLRLGLADSVLDIGSGEMFVHEANLDQLNGVSFNKGCYVGQEVVSRTHHRHTARNRVLPVRFEGDAAHGTDVLSGEKRIGTMLSSRQGFGLALLRIDRLAEATEPLLTSDLKLSVQKPGWAKFELVIPEVAQ
jgi:tRNA-modifying protein YgfZ